MNMTEPYGTYGDTAEGVCPFCGSSSLYFSEGKFTCFSCFSQGKTNEPDHEEERERIRKVCGCANTYFTSRLKPGSGFAASRNLGEAELERFSLGYDDGRLYAYLSRDCGFTDGEILESGLCRRSTDGELRFYDHFRYRITFPVFDENGGILGFGARRTREDNSPKYVNSPESPLFRKRNVLYGIHEFDRLSDTIFLVEGYMDVISLHRAGILNSAAVLGTAAGENLCPLLRKLGIRKVILCFDSDDAGRNATLRAIPALGRFFEVEVMGVEGAKDPDEYLKNHSGADFLGLKRKSAGSVIAENSGYDVETIVNMML